MHTIMVIAGGLVLLGLFLLTGRWIGGGEAATLALAAKVFVPVWLAAALINMWIGVSSAGYTVAEELPILLVIFGVPALAAATVAWKVSSP